MSELLKIRNLTNAPVEICGRLIPARRETTLGRDQVQAWLARGSANRERLQHCLAVRDMDDHDVDLLGGGDPEPETDPPDPEGGGEGNGGDGDGGESSGGEPDEVDRLGELDRSNPDLFDKRGYPTTAVVSSLLGRKVKAAERDEMWGEFVTRNS